MSRYTVITSGSSYLDIDAYACCIALSELKKLQGCRAIAYSKASINSSVSNSLLVHKDKILKEIPCDCDLEHTNFSIVDLSDPSYFEEIVRLDKVVEIYDHHTGFEEFWYEKLGNKSRIHFIGAAATLVYQEWTKHNMLSRMSQDTAKLLLAGILDNTLNLLSSNTTDLDVKAKTDLCAIANVDDEWCQQYFSEVQLEIEKDLRTSLVKDIKQIRPNDNLPSTIGQIAVWDASRIMKRIDEVIACFDSISSHWLMNVIDISEGCSYFICNDCNYRERIANLFEVDFDNSLVKMPKMYLRKEILKIAGYMKK